MGRRLTQEEFINNCEITHGKGTFDYSRTTYVNRRTKVEIGCKKCGLYFDQQAESHSRGAGCPDCNTGEKYTPESFLRRALEKHGTKYQYPTLNSIENLTSHSKIEVFCKEEGHSSFILTAFNHLNGTSCPACLGKSSDNRRKKSPELFIKQAIKIHGDRYDYSETIYNDDKAKVKIKCNVLGHNYFYPTPSNHLSKKVGAQNVDMKVRAEKMQTKKTFGNMKNG